MARTSLSPDAAPRFSAPERATLLELARASIREGLCGQELRVRAENYAVALQARRASFVTLKVEARLRGCIGSVAALQPLVSDVVKNAYGAAFNDPRFSALTWPEFERLDIHVSILSESEPMRFTSEDDLLRQLRPGVDGLIIEEYFHRGTFLPVVWEQIPEPREFLRQLKLKAGLHVDYWSEAVRVSRYTAESIP